MAKESGKFGTRSAPGKLAKSDFIIANAMCREVFLVLSRFGPAMGIGVELDFPSPLDYPGTGDNAAERGESLMNHTLRVTGEAYKLLSSANVRYGYMYKITPMPNHTQSIYHTSVQYVNHEPVDALCDEYIKSLCWVVAMLRKSLENRYPYE